VRLARHGERTLFPANAPVIADMKVVLWVGGAIPIIAQEAMSFDSLLSS
jgi:hypothetical protein